MLGQSAGLAIGRIVTYRAPSSPEAIKPEDSMTGARTLLAPAVAVLAVALTATGVPGTAAAAPTRSALAYDFDGDGRADLAVAAYAEDLGTTKIAGGINVLYAGAQGLSAEGDQFWSRRSPGVKGKAVARSYFGHLVASGDFDADGFADLAAATGSQVNVLHGSRRGLTARGDQLLRSGTGALAAGDFDRDGRDDLALGQWGAAVAGKDAAGRVMVVPGGRSGLRPDASRTYTQASRGVPGTPEQADFFGQSLAAGDLTGDGADELVVGAPGEQVVGRSQQGAVWVLVGRSGRGFSRAQAWNQSSPGIADDPESEGCLGSPEQFGRTVAVGDFDGDRRGDLAIAVPGEATARNAEGDCVRGGLVHVLHGVAGGVTGAGSETFDGSMPSLPDEASQYRFGDTLATGDFNGDATADLAVGSTGDGATATVVYGSSTGLTAEGAQRLTRQTPGIPDGADDPLDEDDTSDLVAARFEGASRDSLVIGSGFHQRTGTVTVVGGSASGLDPESARLWSQDSPGVLGKGENCDYFGAVDGVFDRGFDNQCFG